MPVVLDSIEPKFFTRLKNAYLNLRVKRPNDELLSLATISLEGAIDFSDEYYKRFVDPRDEFGTFGYERYTCALEAAVKD